MVPAAPPSPKPQKPSKLRVVFDCAAKFKGVSLNDALVKGADLVSSLIGALIRFRKEQVAITADIESMFNQVCVDSLHCHALRFLWWPQGDLLAQPEVHQKYTCLVPHLHQAVPLLVYDKQLTTTEVNLILIYPM